MVRLAVFCAFLYYHLLFQSKFFSDQACITEHLGLLQQQFYKLICLFYSVV